MGWGGRAEERGCKVRESNWPLGRKHLKLNEGSVHSLRSQWASEARRGSHHTTKASKWTWRNEQPSDMEGTGAG